MSIIIPRQTVPYIGTSTYTAPGRQSRVALYCGYVLESPWFGAVMLALTLYSLFGDDIRIAVVRDLSYDIIFFVFTIITFIAFCVEMGLQIITVDGYLTSPRCCNRFRKESQYSSINAANSKTTAEQEQHNQTCFGHFLRAWRSVKFGSFHFWLDAASTISVLLEFLLILQDFEGVKRKQISDTGISLARAGRAARVGARIGRLLQMLRASAWCRGRVSTQTAEARDETRVGSRLTELMSQRIIVGVLLCILTIPALSFAPTMTAPAYRTQTIHKFACQAAAHTFLAQNTADWQDMIALSSDATQPIPLPITSPWQYCGNYSFVNCTNEQNDASSAYVSTFDTYVAKILQSSMAPFAVRLNNTLLRVGGAVDHPNADIITLYESLRVKLRVYSEVNSHISAYAVCGSNPNVLLSPFLITRNTSIPCNATSDVWTIVVDFSDTAATAVSASAGVLAVPMHVTAIYSGYDEARLEALWSVGLTLLVIFVLSFGAAKFSYDVNRIVLQPLEQMVRVVRQISANPLITLPDASGDVTPAYTPQQAQMAEVNILLRTLTNIGQLLRMAFGDSGARIITKRLNNAQELNPVTPGEKIYGIFVYVRLCKLAEITAILQEETTLFVNYMARIVHRTAIKHRGIVVKNTSSGFVLMWPLFRSEDETTVNNLSPFADSALICVVRMILEFAGKTKEFKPSEVIPFSSVAYDKFTRAFPNVSFTDLCAIACHAGWALEGPLGSDRKLDAAWLSPHITLARNLSKAVTSTFRDMRFVITHTVYALLSPHVRALCWWISRVKVEPQDANNKRGFDAGFVTLSNLPTAEEGQRMAQQRAAHGHKQAAAAVSRSPSPVSEISSHTSGTSTLRFYNDAFCTLTEEVIAADSTRGGDESLLDPYDIRVNVHGKLAHSRFGDLGNSVLWRLQQMYLREDTYASFSQPVNLYTVHLSADLLQAFVSGADLNVSVELLSANTRRLNDAGARWAQSSATTSASATVQNTLTISHRMLEGVLWNDMLLHDVIQASGVPDTARKRWQAELQMKLWQSNEDITSIRQALQSEMTAASTANGENPAVEAVMPAFVNTALQALDSAVTQGYVLVRAS